MRKLGLYFALFLILVVVAVCVQRQEESTEEKVKESAKELDEKIGNTHCYLRIRKDPEWYQNMLNLVIADPNRRVSVRAVTHEEDPSKYTHVIVSFFHSPGMSNWDPELKKLPNLTSMSVLSKLDENCNIVSTEEIIDEFGAEEDEIIEKLNMRKVKIPNYVW